PDAVTAQSSSSEQAVRGYTGTVAVIQDSNISAPPSTAIPMRARKQTTTATSSKEVRPFPGRSCLVTSRAPRVTASHARSLCILSTDARIRSPPATLHAMLWPSAYTMPTVDDAKSRDLGKWTIPGSGILPGGCRQLRHFGGSLAEPTQANEFSTLPWMTVPLEPAQASERRVS